MPQRLRLSSRQLQTHTNQTKGKLQQFRWYNVFYIYIQWEFSKPLSDLTTWNCFLLALTAGQSYKTRLVESEVLQDIRRVRVLSGLYDTTRWRCFGLACGWKNALSLLVERNVQTDLRFRHSFHFGSVSAGHGGMSKENRHETVLSWVRTASRTRYPNDFSKVCVGNKVKTRNK